MEMQEDKIIRDKINVLTGLPKGYQVNLESKWTLLEAGLAGNRKKTFPWVRVAAAILLVVLCGGWLMRDQQKEETRKFSAEPKKPVNKSVNFPTATLSIVPVAEKKVHVHRGSGHPTVCQDTLISKNYPEQVTEKDEPVQEQIQPVLEPVAEKNTPKRKQRFVELDFSEGLPPNTTYAEPPVAGQQFRIRWGANSTFSGQKTKTGNNSRLKLKQTF